MKKDFNILIFIFNILILTMIKAENEDVISTGRPGASNPMTAIEIGQFQIEIGYNYNVLDTSSSLPFLFRTGIYDNLEIQLGYSDGYNIALLYEDIHIINGLNNSILVTIAPDNNNDKKIDTIEEINSIDIYIPWSLENYPIAGQLATVSNGNGLNIDYSISIGGNLNKKTGWFIECFENSDFDIWTDAGFTYLIQKNMQIDFSSGMQINNIENIFLEFGFSYRLPN